MVIFDQNQPKIGPYIDLDEVNGTFWVIFDQFLGFSGFSGAFFRKFRIFYLKFCFFSSFFSSNLILVSSTFIKSLIFVFNFFYKNEWKISLSVKKWAGAAKKVSVLGGRGRQRERNRNIIEQESTSRAGLVVQTIRSCPKHFFIDLHHQSRLSISPSGRSVGDGWNGGKRKKVVKRLKEHINQAEYWIARIIIIPRSLSEKF